MNKLEKRGQEIARARQLLAMERLVTMLMADYPGVRVEADESRVRLSGAGLVKRWLSETQLRFVGGLMKSGRAK